MSLTYSPLADRTYALILTVGGLMGLVAMTWQAAERVHMLKNPGLELGCNLNPVVDCSGVLNDKLSAIMGFPNAFLGMIFFAILLTSGLVLLSGGKFSGWYRHFVMSVSTVLLLFSGWFFWVSLFVLGKICLFCVVGWVVAVPIFWYGMLHFLQSRTSKRDDVDRPMLSFARKHHLDVVVGIYIAMSLLFLYRFRDYYFG